MLSWSRVDLESKGVSWRYGKRNKLEEQVYVLKKEKYVHSQKKKVALIVMEDVHTCCLGD